MEKTEISINFFGIKSMIEMSELLATSEERSLDDVPPMYTEMLILLYKRLDGEQRQRLRFSYPIATKELDEYLE